jgi:glutathione synthase
VNIAFVVNHVATEQDNYTTVRLAWKACNAGHRVSFIELDAFVYALDGTLHACAIQPGKRRFKGDRDFLADLQGANAQRQRIAVGELDVLMLRSDPAQEVTARPWAPASALLFAQLAAAAGVIVLNDPTHLTDASNKTYFQSFPERVRPRTAIARDAGEIKGVIDELGGTAVIKPLQGSGGHGVFVVTPDFGPNLNQMIEAVSSEG